MVGQREEGLGEPAVSPPRSAAGKCLSARLAPPGRRATSSAFCHRGSSTVEAVWCHLPLSKCSGLLETEFSSAIGKREIPSLLKGDMLSALAADRHPSPALEVSIHF